MQQRHSVVSEGSSVLPIQHRTGRMHEAIFSEAVQHPPRKIRDDLRRWRWIRRRWIALRPGS